MELPEVYLWILLFFLGLSAFILSTISGGGGALILIPIAHFLFPANQVAPLLNLGTFLGRPGRLILFWKHIHWKLVAYYAPAGILGAWLAARLFSELRIEWLQLLIGLFLISTVFQFRFGKRKRSFPMHLIFFIPLGLMVSILSTIVGGLGPILNPFYLNIGLDKEALIATKTANSFLVGIAQISSYTFFGLLTPQLWIYGIILGLGATLG
ncbi:MAG: sulfite exporter TauE/SafE family protein, partial [Bacteroidota bacterium]